jgi:hypothetical protein
MGKSTTEIKREIETTRHDMEDTVDALGYKLDVKERTKDRVGGLASKPKDAILRIKDSVTGTVAYHTPDVDSVKETSGRITHSVAHGAQQVAGVTKQRAVHVAHQAKENPTALALGGVALGVLAGLAIPSTRVEDERLGSLSDQVKDTVKETGQEALSRGKDVVETTAHSAIETAKVEATTQAEAMKSDAATSSPPEPQEFSSFVDED